MVSCFDTEGIFKNNPRNKTEISAASSAMVQVTVQPNQGHPEDHLTKIAGKDVHAISKNGMKVTEILTPSKYNGDNTPGLLKDRVSSSKDTIIHFFTKQTATKKEDTTTTPSYMSGVAQEGIRTSRLDPTYGGMFSHPRSCHR